MTLSAQQISAVQFGDAVSVVIDETDCVVVRKDVYDRMTQCAFDDSAQDIREAYPLMDAVATDAGWDDPSEDLYDDLVPPKT